MSKELINEIESKIAWNDMNIDETSISLRDVKRLLNELEEQAERVEELEKVIGDLDENVAAFETLWLEEKRKNKRYRKAIERALDESGWGDEGNALHRTISILAKALEGDDD